MDEKLRALPLTDIQCDEIWTFVGKKEARVKPTDNAAIVGDQYTFVAIDRYSKLVINFAVGKRTAPMTKHFTADLADRLIERPQVSTDSFGAYKLAIRKAFDGHVDHGQIVKIYERGVHGAHRESPPRVEKTIRTTMTGEPRKDEICTSHVERSNLSMRTFMRRLTRLCLGFSKKLENLKSAVALYFAWYNFVRVHSTLKTTPAMAAGVTGKAWTLAELLKVG
jgi:IS1 family transposase